MVKGTLVFIRQSVIVAVQVDVVRDTIVVEIVRAFLLVRDGVTVRIFVNVIAEAIQVCIFCTFYSVRYA